MNEEFEELTKEQELLNEGICPKCDNELPPAVIENRDQGYTEAVIYCKCGATYYEK